MNRTIRFAIIVVGILLIGVLAYFFLLRPFLQNSNGEEGQLNDEERAELMEYLSVVNSQYEKFLFTGVSTGSPYGTPQLYMSDFVEDRTIQLMDRIHAVYSNYIAETGTWYTVDDNTLYKHTLEQTETVGAISNSVIRSPKEVRNGLAVSSDEQYIAWITQTDGQQEVILYSLTEKSEEVIFIGENSTTLRSLTWSPNNNELAMVDGNDNVVTIDTNGVQTFNPVGFAWTNVNYLEWIEEDIISAVHSSHASNPEPFATKIVLFNRDGIVFEEYPVLEEVGIPRVLWAPDGSRYAYYNPWGNQFVVYNRFNELENIVSVRAAGTILPFGWTTGTTPPTISETTPPELILTVPDETPVDVPTPTQNFDVSASEWEELNTLHKSLVDQFRVQSGSYRFETTDSGVQVAVLFSEEQENPEHAFIQLLLQNRFLTPTVPSISLQATTATGTTYQQMNFTTEDAEALTQQFTTQPFDQLFIVTEDNPLGDPVAKSGQPQFSYLGDIIYSKGGDYNPYPALAFMQTMIDPGEKLLWRDEFSFVYPTHWLERNLGETPGDPFAPDDTLFYTDDTEFRSPNSWTGFSVEIRQYSIPEVTLGQWLFVNRSDREAEPIETTLHSGHEAVKISQDNEFTLEYIIKSGNTVYSITMNNSVAISEDDASAMQRIVETFTNHNSFVR